MGDSYAGVFAGGDRNPPPRVRIPASCAPPPCPLSRQAPSLLDRRLIFITGKGGVGKSLVAATLGTVAARSGLRTLVAELASQERVQRVFEQPGGALRGGRARARAVHDLSRSRARDGRVPQREDRRRRAGARRQPAVPRVRDGDAGDAGAAQHRQGVGARAVRAAHRGAAPTTSSSSTHPPRATAPASFERQRRLPRSPASVRSPVRGRAIAATIADHLLTGVDCRFDT